MKRLSFIALAALIILQACAEQPAREDSPVFRGVMEGLSTRTALDRDGDHYNINWVEGDLIAVTDGTAAAVYKASSGGTATTDFSKVSGDEFTGGRLTAFYPQGISGYSWPASQNYAAGNVAEVPMMAISDNTEFNFRNLGGVIRLELATTAKDIAVSRIEITADKGLSGPFEVVSGSAVVSGNEGVALVCREPVAIGSAATAFHISVPAQTYKEFTIRVVTSAGQESILTLKPGDLFRVGRSQICEIAAAVNTFSDYKGGKAVLMEGPECNELVKRMVAGKNTERVSSTDTRVRKVVFKTHSFEEGTIRVDSYLSEVPVYASYADGTLTFSTRASEIYAGENASFLFAYLNRLEGIENLKALNTSDTKYFNNMFCFSDTTCRSLKALDLSGFNTEKAVTFTSMFYNCCALTSLDLSSFKTPNLEFTSYMFANCKKLTSLDISNFDTGKVRSMEFMFYHCESIPALDLKHFDTGLCENMDNMFSDCHKAAVIDVSSFRTPKVQDMRSMFNRCRALKTLDLSGFSNESLTNMPYIFQSCESLESGNFDKFGTSQVKSMSYTFRYAYSLKELDLHTWDLRHVTTMAYSYQYCTSLRKLDFSGENCSTDSLATANHFMNASNEIRELRLGKNFNLQKFTNMPNLFFQGKGYLKATEADPMKIYCTATFAQKSLRYSEQALDHTNRKLIVWYSITDGKTPLKFDQEPGSMTNTVTVTDPVVTISAVID